jgi:dTDP-glucose 4,6-dehydratase
MADTAPPGAVHRPRRILVTGGSGFIGANFVRHALATDATVRLVNLDALTYAGNPANLTDIAEAHRDRYRFVHGDICDEALVGRLFADEAIDTVAHFAAESHVDRSIDGPGAFVRTNVTGTLVLLQAARATWGKRSDVRFHHVSTDEVYGSLGAKGRFSESTPYDPSSPYSASKAASDHLVRAWHRTYGLPVTVSNCSNNYGPYQFPEKLIPLMIANALDGKPLPVYGDGQNIRDWLHVGDHCLAIDAVIRRGRAGTTYNVGGDQELTNLALVHALCDILDRERPRAGGHRALIAFVADRPGHDRRYAIDASRIQAELGWRPRETIATGLAATVRWYLDHAQWVADIQARRYAGERLGLK